MKDIFIAKSQHKHNNKFDYSQVEYVNSRTKVTIICKIHGKFYITPSNHIAGGGCKRCSDDKYRGTAEQFMKRANLVHSNKYIYTDVQFININTKVEIMCQEHGTFKQTPKNHLNNHGCPICGNKKRNESTRKSLEEFIIQAHAIHGDKYDFSKCNYESGHKKIKIKCKIHGSFKISPVHLLNGVGCNKCSKCPKYDDYTFVQKAKEVHSNKYDYSYVCYVNSKTKIKINCKQHGIYMQTPAHHLKGVGCPGCRESKGEKSIADFLEKNKIEFIRQHVFSDCYNPKTNYKLKFDFYISKFNICIEFDGMQHFKAIKNFGGDVALKKCREFDKIKNDFCAANNILLIRIKYNENIVKKLTNYLYFP